MQNSLQVVCELMVDLADQCHLSCFSETVNPEIFSYATLQVKDHLLQVGMLGF